jgi:transcriptional regulator with XRE-family HTH domain
MSGKPRRHVPTREGQRFSWLILQLEQKGLSQAEICRRTGIAPSHLNQLRNIERGSRSGIGAEIVRKVKDGLGIDPAYFFDDYEGQKPFELYSLSAKRDENRVAAIEKGLAEDQRQVATLQTELAKLRELVVAQGAELATTRAERREATRARANAELPPRQPTGRQRKVTG